LATISTAGKVANSATTATSTNTASAIVARDGSGNFSTTMITLTGTTTNATDAATKAYVDSLGTDLNTPNTIVKRDGTGSFSAQTISIVDEVALGIITASAGSAAIPSLQFNGSTNTGLSAAIADSISFDTNGVERMAISEANMIVSVPYCNQAIQAVSITGNNQSVTASSTTSVLILKPTGNRTNFTVRFPASPTNGQYFTILLGATFTVSVINAGNGASVVNGITSYSSSPGQASSTYFYYATDNTWYRERTS